MQTSYSVRLRERGQLTLPKTVRQSLSVDQGDMLNLVQIGDAFILSPQQPLLPQLSEEFSAIMEDENMSLAELLQGLEEERKAIWQERQDRDG
jgi:bifunctional DNA-binding transcriptional regulator/antitoxin component of YhaV-PrlF toxin-antitoxin module